MHCIAGPRERPGCVRERWTLGLAAHLGSASSSGGSSSQWVISTGVQTVGSSLAPTGSLWEAELLHSGSTPTTLSPRRAEPCNSPTATPWGMEFPRRWCCSREGKTVGRQNHPCRPPSPTQWSSHSCHLAFQAHRPFCLKLQQASRRPQFA